MTETVTGIQTDARRDVDQAEIVQNSAIGKCTSRQKAKPWAIASNTTSFAPLSARTTGLAPPFLGARTKLKGFPVER